MANRFSTVARGTAIGRFGAMVLLALAICLLDGPIALAAAARGSNRASPGPVRPVGRAATTSAGTPDQGGPGGPLMNWPLVARHGVRRDAGDVSVAAGAG